MFYILQPPEGCRNLAIEPATRKSNLWRCEYTQEYVLIRRGLGGGGGTTDVLKRMIGNSFERKYDN